MEKVLIIGGGVAGLSAGIYAQKSGYKSIIAERHDKLGGQLTGWQRGGYHVDNCIHWLTGTNKNTALYKQWNELGMLGDVDIIKAESLYTYEKGGVRLSLCADIKKLENDMLAVAPEDVGEIKALISAVETVKKFSGTGGENDDEKLSLSDILFRCPSLLRYSLLTVGELANMFDNKVIRGFLCSLLTKDFSAIALLTVFATFTSGNGYLPAGGSLKAAQRMAERYLSLGGTAYCNKEAVRLNVEKGRARSVTFADGSEISADAFIFTGDPKMLFNKVIDGDMPFKLKRLYKSKAYKRFSAFQCAYSCDLAVLNFKGDFIFEPRYKFKKLTGSDYLVLKEFSHESSFAPENKTVLQAMVVVDENRCRDFIDKYRDKERYDELKKAYIDVITAAIIKKFPKLKESLYLLDSWTPATYRNYTLTETGSFMSFAFKGGVLPKKVSGKIPGIKNAFLATQWQHSPGGLPIAAECGRCAVELILSRRISGGVEKGAVKKARFGYSK